MEAALSTAPPEILALVRADSQRTNQYEALTNAYKPLPGVTRKFVEGREYLDMLRNEEEFYARSVNYYRHRITRIATSNDMMHPEVAGNRSLKEYSMQHVENAMTPDNPFSANLSKLFTFNDLLCLGNTMLEGVQNLGTGMQAIIGQTGSVTDAYRLWGQAIGDTTKKSSRSADMQWMFDRTEAMGIRRRTDFLDIYDPDTQTINEVLSKNPVVKGLNAIQVGATKWSTFFQRFNDNIGLAAGFRFGHGEGNVEGGCTNVCLGLKRTGALYWR